MICDKTGTPVDKILEEAIKQTLWGKEIYFKIDYLGLQGAYGEEVTEIFVETIAMYIKQYTDPVPEVYVADVDLTYAEEELRKAEIKILLKEEI